MDAPPAPDGFEHRWIRTAIRGEDDKSNVFSRMREGWEPVRADEYGAEAAKYPVIEEGKNKGNNWCRWFNVGTNTHRNGTREN